MAIIKPRVARNELPWVVVKRATNSEGVEAQFHFAGDSTLTELAQEIFSPGSAKPGLYDRNPVGVATNNRALAP